MIEKGLSILHILKVEEELMEQAFLLKWKEVVWKWLSLLKEGMDAQGKMDSLIGELWQRNKKDNIWRTNKLERSLMKWGKGKSHKSLKANKMWLLNNFT